MLFSYIRKWIDQWRSLKHIQDSGLGPTEKIKNLDHPFSPMTYQNPYIVYMHDILGYVISQRKLSYQRLELVVIDAEDDRDRDDDDIQMVLYALEHRLNYLLLITDRPERYGAFIDEMYEENGLIVQYLPKCARRRARGNLVLDFERSGGFLEEDPPSSKAIYVPIYKRPWEISENLDILVPVGYNTLVVDGIFPPDSEESCSMDERFKKDTIIDRLDREFRKG